MAFILPTFNLLSNVWNPGVVQAVFPVIPPPTHSNVPCQLRAPPPASTASWYFFETWPWMWILFPKGTDVRAPNAAAYNPPQDYGVIECPSGSTEFFYITNVIDTAKGFTNEYRVALCVPSLAFEYDAVALFGGLFVPAWPTPYP